MLCFLQHFRNKPRKRFQIIYFGFKSHSIFHLCSLISPISLPYISYLVYPVLIYRSYYASGGLSSEIANLLPIMTCPVTTAISPTLQQRPVVKQLQNWVFFWTKGSLPHSEGIFSFYNNFTFHFTLHLWVALKYIFSSFISSRLSFCPSVLL
jgi:hypothetical protein